MPVEAKLKAPFPWFGGKSLAAPLVWARFGDVASFNDPCCGSLAMLWGRPASHGHRIETVNDVDCYLANFWRALQHDPDGVAFHADWPVNEADLHARHRWLVEKGRPIAERVMREPEFYDLKIAGWWVWGQCLWIGSGWCQHPDWKGRAAAGRKECGINAERVKGFGKAGYGVDQKRRPHLSGQQGIVSQRTAASFRGETPHEQHKRPKLRSRGTDGIAFEQVMERTRPKLTNRGDGISHRRWQGGGAGGGSGVHAPSLHLQKPQLGGDGSGAQRGYQREGVRTEGIYNYMRALAARLRRVRVCCGDWKRVLTPSVTTYIGVTGVFLDPPYDHELRERCYSEDHNISAEVREWAIEHGDDRKFRIALCGYEGEHDKETSIERDGKKVTIPPMPANWECVAWKAHGGYSRTARGRENRARERIWFSPHCLKPGLELWEEPLMNTNGVILRRKTIQQKQTKETKRDKE